MMRFLMKVIFLALTIYLCIRFTRIGREQYSYVSNLTKTMMAQQEVNSISSAIYSEFASDRKGIPDASSAFWTDFIHNHLDSRIAGRDLALDQWKTAFRIRRLDRLPGYGGKHGFVVTSAGPDRQFGTGDDISVTSEFREQLVFEP